MDLLKYRSFPEIASAVRDRATAVVELWLQIARANVPTAGELSADELRDHLGVTMRMMAETLESDQPMTLSELMNKATLHGDVRFDQQYNLSELMTEYALIRPILIEQVTEQLSRPMEPEEIIALNLAVDVAVKQGVLAFSDHHKNELQKSAESRAKYLSFLSHDLRGGLNGTLLMIEVLRRELQGHEQFAESVQDLESMRRSILDTVGTMDRFLHAEKLRNGKVVPHVGPVNLTQVVRDVVNQLAWVAKDKGVTIESNTDGDGVVNSDRELLILIVQNLVSNAVKYCRGKVSVAIDKVHGNARITVVDNGPGIAPDFLAKVFAPYSRGNTHGEQGTGLGLFIARQSADLLNVKLTATSVLGSGSTFAVEIPSAS